MNNKQYKKVLILGSGALKIGEAGEFDYSGSQAIKALKEEGIRTILINPNIATIQTSEFLADEVYFLPVNPYFVEEVIKKEKPEAILISFGGQTALNCGMALHKRGILEKYNVEILGTSIESVIIAEDRQKFAQHLRKIGIKTPESKAATTMSDARVIAEKIGYPVMIRAAFALGGQKSGVAQNAQELTKIVTDALAFSSQVLVEKYLHHYKEIEYEVVRDQYDNCITVCNMENMDPLGIHTGESVVVAPSQTLTNHEYHMLRKISIELVRSLNIVGECNVQFALNPNPHPNPLPEGAREKDTLGGALDYDVIELNPRLSRSSALASKATGYPLAYVGAKLILGKSLMEVENKVTKVTKSAFEPALDYVVVKIPRWDLDKFAKVDDRIGSSMKSVGEVMAIGRTFEEALQKAVRMLDIGAKGVTENNFPKTEAEFMPFILKPTPKRLFAIVEALTRSMTVSQLHDITGIDDWFLFRLEAIVACKKELSESKTHSKELILLAKQLGFADSQIGLAIGKSELEVRKKRIEMGIIPSIFQIDTLAGEVPAQTNYLYLTYNGSHNDVEPTGKEAVIVLGSGPYRIGSSVEFDWTCVNTAMALQKHHKKSIIINCNPETVSTDYDMSDKLYFEELTFERVMDIYEFEKALGVIVSVGGQTPNNIARNLAQASVHILGTQAVDIDRAEDRNKFSKLLDELGVLQPEWNTFTTIDQAIKFAEKVEYPVLIRPSYVLSGAAMNVCFNEDELVKYSKKATVVNTEHPIIVSKFISNAKELELDAVAMEGKIQVSAISEHLEHAGVHSGDATIIFPPQRIYLGTEKKVNEIAHKIAEALNITGPFNIQFMAKNNQVYVIEVNVRSSRTFPFISKATRVNFAQVLTDAMLGKSTKIDIPYPNFVLVKASQFSFSRLEGADPVLRVEMSSTGEVGCFGDSVEEAFFKAELSVGAKVPKKGIFLSLGGDENKIRFLSSIMRLKTAGIPIYATEKTAKFLRANGVKAKVLYKIHENKKPNVLTYFQNGKIDFAVNIPDYNFSSDLDDDYVIRRAAVDHNIHLLTNFQKASLFIKSFIELQPEQLEARPWSDYR